MRFLTDFADQGVILPVALMALLAFAVLRWWRGAGAWIAVVVTAFALVLLLKIVFHTCGEGTPASPLFNPSGHVASATAVYGGLAAVVLGQYRAAALLPALLIAVLIAATRLALGVHTVADVVAGGVIGMAAVMVLRRLAGPLPSSRCWQPALLALAVAVLLHGAHLDAEGAIRDLAARLRPAVDCGRQP
jgi:membrane-associated phospholipid phosphatase